MLSNVENGELQHRSANACLCPLYSVDGMHVVTVEGQLIHKQLTLAISLRTFGKLSSKVTDYSAAKHMPENMLRPI